MFANECNIHLKTLCNQILKQLSFSLFWIVLRCRAATNPSPPLLPGPQTNNVVPSLNDCSEYDLTILIATLKPANSINWSTLNPYSLNNS
ncbi:hypothetical protein BLOT_001153 [Blomia tropicalis]|nr:hypothetical protein BLOT_001153 [Blomia tropicalis]